MKIYGVGLVALILTVAGSMHCCANHIFQTDSVYVPGYVDFALTLDEFLPKSMAPACQDLEQGNLKDAEPKFATALKKEPDDPALIIGFLQAARGHRDALLNSYVQAERASHSEGNEFRLAVLAYYMIDERWDKGQPSPAHALEINNLSKITVDNMSAAYRQATSPVVGFFMLNTQGVVHYDVPGDHQSDLADILRRFAGRQMYNQYTSAKSHGWRVSTPQIPQVTHNQLQTARIVIGYMWAWGKNRSTLYHEVSGKYVSTDTTPKKTTTEKDMYDFLGRWRKVLISALQSRK